MKKLTLTIIFLFAGIISFESLYAQKDPIRDEFLDAEFFLAEEQYAESLQAYMKVYNAGNQENANINYRIGMCYANLPGEKSKAIPFLEKAVQNISSSWKEGSYRETSAPPDAWLYLGNVYRVDYQLDNAIESYNKFIEFGSKGKSADSEFAVQQVEACKRAKIAISDPASVKIEKLSSRFNTNQNNFQPVLSGDGNSMAFMTSLRFYDAVYYAWKINNTWTNTVNITSQIESDGDQYVTSLSYDGKTMYLVKESLYGGIIMESSFSGGRWTKSRPLDKNINTKYFESHASISPDGNTLYFTSNRRESIGGMDIFMAEKDESGKWGIPVNPGPVVNTTFNEESPHICNDGKTLFFSSQGHDNIGGYDIFYTVRQDDNTWSKPVRLPYPVNTPDDDLYFYPVENGTGGYMTLYGKDGNSSGDIYFFNIDAGEEIAEVIQEEPADKETEKVEDVVPSPEEIEEVPEIAAEEMKPAETVKYSVKPIYFDFDRYSLSSESIDKLDLIAGILKEFPDMVIEIRGHTDAIGPVQYNQVLSERRARSALDYLVSQGIVTDRLRHKGLSLNEPAARNRKPDGTDSPEGRRLNRRVEFRVLVNPKNAVIIQESEVPDHLKIN